MKVSILISMWSCDCKAWCLDFYNVTAVVWLSDAFLILYFTPVAQRNTLKTLNTKHLQD